MILVCENCKSTFLVPASYFVAGPRTVRCGKCKQTWLADAPKKTPPMDPPTPPPEPAPQAASPRQASPAKPQETAPTPPPKPAKAPRKPFNVARLVRLSIASLALTLGISGVMALTLVLLHGPIIRQWPSMQAFYISLGLAKPPEKDRLYLVDIQSERRYQDGAMHLIVGGSIRNGAPKTQVIPTLAVEAVGPDGRVIQSWRIEPPQATVRPGMTVPFSSAILSPEAAVVEVNLSFVEQPRDDEP